MKKILGMASLISALAYPQAAVAMTAVDGLRVGIQAGYGVTDSKVTVQAPNASDNSDISGRGAIGGVMIDWGRFLNGSKVLMGLEASVNFSNSTGKKDTQGTLFGPASTNLQTKVDLRQAYDLSAKLGYVVMEAVLPYVKAGITSARWKVASNSTQLGTGSSSATRIGFLVGLGIDFSVKERVSLGAEYAYRQYGNMSHDINNNAGQSMTSVKVRPSANTIMIRLNYKIK